MPTTPQEPDARLTGSRVKRMLDHFSRDQIIMELISSMNICLREDTDMREDSIGALTDGIQRRLGVTKHYAGVSASGFDPTIRWDGKLREPHSSLHPNQS